MDRRRVPAGLLPLAPGRQPYPVASRSCAVWAEPAGAAGDARVPADGGAGGRGGVRGARGFRRIGVVRAMRLRKGEQWWEDDDDRGGPHGEDG